MGKLRVLLGATVLLWSSVSNAGVISGGDLLDQEGADRIESWLGVGDLDFSNIWDGVVGDTASDWHSAVDGVAQTISIYDINYLGQQVLIGGYNGGSWDSSSSWVHDEVSFIFNLTTGIMQTQDTPESPSDTWSIFNSMSYFATFGGGHDLFGGTSTIGSSTGYANSFTYGDSHSDTNIQGSGCTNTNTLCMDPFTVNGLETYTFASAQSVPEPSIIALFGAGLIGLGFARRRRLQF